MENKEQIIISNRRQGKNIYTIKEDVAELEINSKKYGKLLFIIDASLLDIITKHYWGARCYRGHFYAYTHLGGYKYISLHRLITQCPNNLMVDHINHDTFDNRSKNLKICTNKENQQLRNSLSDSLMFKFTGQENETNRYRKALEEIEEVWAKDKDGDYDFVKWQILNIISRAKGGRMSICCKNCETLAEIKEIAKLFCSACQEFKPEKKGSNCMYCNYGKILQKISECEVKND